ncbi:hypothetical protein BO85DRAFT_86119 [Aspergillus piperis CBS 112811]|uniref:Uncharacterized protein n=1 Tax=Aspergillus piperis CBS 112811 TaxID=1448313 RepID=A0A8G1VJP1_9EURO|nr:hypothetical protein BO85DRAFT_86119 [Aspergillus piperis CBS 112811]RAH54890.1 hypothetical protein BO85DRAFT_86119 [Aspergillus piperis CBS 112811]
MLNYKLWYHIAIHWSAILSATQSLTAQPSTQYPQHCGTQLAISPNPPPAYCYYLPLSIGIIGYILPSHTKPRIPSNTDIIIPISGKAIVDKPMSSNMILSRYTEHLHRNSASISNKESRPSTKAYYPYNSLNRQPYTRDLPRNYHSSLPQNKRKLPLFSPLKLW